MTSRSSSCSGTQPAVFTTISAWSGTERSRAGPFPRGCRIDRGSRRLAVHVEDHPLSYASFEGEIPKGEYGAGTVEIWDRGKYELLEEKRDGGLTFRLRGERLQGVWTLVPAAMDGDEKNWLLLRKSDDRGPGADLPRYEPMLSTLAARRADWQGLALRDQVGRLPHDRACSRGRREPRQPDREGSDGGPVRSRSPARFRGRFAAPSAWSTGRSAPSTRRAARASRRCSEGPERSSSISSTFSSSTASPCSTSRSSSATSGSGRSWSPARRVSGSPRSSRTAVRFSRRRESRVWKGSWRSGRRRRTSRVRERRTG